VVARLLWEQEVLGSNPSAPTSGYRITVVHHPSKVTARVQFPLPAPELNMRKIFETVILGAANLTYLGMSLGIVDYERAKTADPSAAWPQTSSSIDITAAALLGISSIVVLGLLTLITLKKLEIRGYLWMITALTSVVAVLTIWYLGDAARFVLFPS
jgi:hypothetical protein